MVITMFPHCFHRSQVEEALGGSMGSGDVFEAELQHVAALAACAANMRVFDEGKWKSDVGSLEKRFVQWIFGMDFEGIFQFFMDFDVGYSNLFFDFSMLFFFV